MKKRHLVVRRLFEVTLLQICFTLSVCAQDIVKFGSLTPAGQSRTVEAVISLPKAPENGEKRPAVILVHSIGGWQWPVTGQYAAPLAAAGFVVLEPRLFPDKSQAIWPTHAALPLVYDALRYLAARPDVDAKRIGLAGFSYGGALTIYAATSWAQSTFGKSSDMQFSAFAPFYPICWAFASVAQGQRKVPGIPGDFFARFGDAPMRIFAGGRDDYDDRDPKACDAMISAIPLEFRQSFSVKVFPDATHGWDQRAARFHEPLACKGRGCTNSNEPNDSVTKEAMAEMIDFFSRALAARR